PAPAPAERARDRRVDRPDEPGPGDVLDGRVRLGGADLRGQVRAGRLQRVDLLGVRALPCAQRVETDLLLLSRGLELPLVRDELVAQLAHLVDADGDDLG